MPKIAMLGARLGTFNARRVALPAKETDPFYLSPEHIEWRDKVIARAGGYCQDPLCKAPNRKPSRLFADHVHEVKDGGAKFDPANGLARCGSCHTRKTHAEKRKRQAREDEAHKAVLSQSGH